MVFTYPEIFSSSFRSTRHRSHAIRPKASTDSTMQGLASSNRCGIARSINSDLRLSAISERIAFKALILRAPDGSAGT